MQGVLQNENPLAATDSLKIGGPLSPPLMQPISPSSQVNDIVVKKEEEEEEEEEEEVFEITIRGKTYFTADAVNGEFYAVLKDDEIGDEVGSFKKGIPQFN